MRHAVFPGTFAPFTRGHYDTVWKAARLFDCITIVVAYNSAKAASMFTLADRLDMIEAIDEFKHFKSEIRIRTLEETVPLAAFVKRVDAGTIVRGIRNAVDYEYESGYARINERIEPNLQTVFFPAHPALSDISSSVVRTLLTMEGWERTVAPMIPATMWETFLTIVRTKDGVFKA